MNDHSIRSRVSRVIFDLLPELLAKIDELIERRIVRELLLVVWRELVEELHQPG